MHLLSRGGTVRKAQANSEQLISFFVDNKRTCYLTWIHGISMDLSEVRIKGRMLNFIQNFLRTRSFKVEVNEILSDTKIQTEGISQGNIVSPIFSILKINEFLVQLPNENRFQISLYKDDLQISYRHPGWRTVERRLQDRIAIVEKFAQKNGFKFNTSKTFMLHFIKLSSRPRIELRLDNIRIQNSVAIKYLGSVFDSKLVWKAHIQQLKSICDKALNLMRNVSATEWVADHKILIMIYRSLVRSKIDYGCKIYNSASSRKLASLKTVSNEA